MGRRCGRRGGDGAQPTSARSLEELAAAVRRSALRVAAEQARQLRLVAQLADRCEAAALAELARGPRVPGQPLPEAVADSAMTGEVMAVLGIAEGPAQRLVGLSRRLTKVLPEALTALGEGRLDLPRVRALVDATELVDDDTARRVAAGLLERAGDRPWAGPSPRSWRARVDRAVVVADPGAAYGGGRSGFAERAVSAWAEGEGTGALLVRATDHDIVLVDGVITDLAHAWAGTGPGGEPLGMDQARVDAFVDVFRRIRDGREIRDGGSPVVGRRRDREIGLVLHTDTLFGDGPAARAPGELRGLGAPAPVDPVTAAQLARAGIAGGAGVQVLVTDSGGVLQRLVRLPGAPAGGWTRDRLVGAVRAAWPGLPGLCTAAYAPTGAIAAHVRAAQPRCVSYDCARVSRRCDLDHVEAWPRGPTADASMVPRCRRHHEHKTRRLVHTVLHGDGSVDTRMLTGIMVRTGPEPLPGYGPGEGYANVPGTTAG